jgi:cytochrome c2
MLENSRLGVALGLAAALLATTAKVAGAQTPAGDPAKGAQVFDARCSDCHGLQGVHQGPSLVGVVGRRAASLAGYDYSPALRASGLAWNLPTLDRFLAAPRAVVPGTTMGGIVPDPVERRNVIAYLATLSPK